ncbi:GNAT family N-acetyltransferase [Arthrobacter sp. UYCu712]|uniref:GNAT family N-acetyltransferase n=1 Tax=Arthrobacter sp. UYCu712 TaxID=3156340 RepID=UPI00339A49C9
MAAIANDSPPDLDDLAAYQREGRAWVATDSGDEPVAYILVEDVDRRAHIEQVTVHPLYARQGLGRSLIEEVARWAVARGLEGMTLTTFEEVPWNAPYYTRLGFVRVPECQWSQGVRRIVQVESAHGLDAWPRVVMKKMLTRAEPSVA